MPSHPLLAILRWSSDGVLYQPVDGAVFHRSPSHPSIISLQWVHCFHILSYLLCPRSPTVHLFDCSLSLSPLSHSPTLFDYITRFVPFHNPSYILSVFLNPPSQGRPWLCHPHARGHFKEEEEDGVKLKCRGGGEGGGKSTYTQTHNSQSTLGDWQGPRNLSSLEHLILGSGPRTTISVHNWHRPPETL